MNKLNDAAGQFESAAPSINDRNSFPVKTMNKLWGMLSYNQRGSINVDAENSTHNRSQKRSHCRSSSSSSSSSNDGGGGGGGGGSSAFASQNAPR